MREAAFSLSRTAVTTLLGLAVAACTKPVGIPNLPGPTPQPIENIVLSDRLSARELRGIFRSLNANGQFNSLKPWLETPEDAALDGFLNWFNATIFEDSLSKDSLISLARNRAHSAGFSKWQSQVTGSDPRTLSAVRWLLTDKNLPPLTRRLLPLFDETFQALTREMERKAATEFNSYGLVHKSIAENSVSRAAADVRVLLVTPQSQDLISRLLTTLDEQNTLGSLFLGLGNLNLQYPFAAPFVSASHFLSSNLVPTTPTESAPAKNLEGQTQKLLRFFDLLNHPSNGLFIALENGMKKNPSVTRVLGEKLRPKVLESYAHAVLWEISQHELLKTKAFWVGLSKSNRVFGTPQYQSLTEVIRTGLENLEGLAEQTSGDYAVRRVGKIINSLVIARWFTSVVQHNADIVATLPEGPSFLASFWNQPLAIPEMEIKILETPAGSPRTVSPWVSDQLKGMGEEGILSSLQLFSQDPTYGAEAYFFPAAPKESVGQSLVSVLTLSDQVNNFGSVTGIAIAFLRSATGLSGETKFRLSALETSPNDTMLAAVHRFVSGLSIEKSEIALTFLLKDLGLAELPPEMHDLIMQLLPESSAQATYLNQILDGLPTLNSILHAPRGLPSFLAVFHGLLQATPPIQQNGIHEFFSTLHHLRIFSIDKATGPIYPGLFSSFQGGQSLAEVLHLFSVASPDQRNIILRTFEDAFEGPQGWSVYLDTLTRLGAESPQSFEYLLAKVLDHGWDLLPSADEVTPLERKWLARFIISGQLQEIQQYLMKYGSKEDGIRLLKELERTTQNGTLSQGLEALARVKSDRMHHIAATLLELVKSGEFLAILKSLESVFGS